MSGLCWKRLHLRGFGVHTDTLLEFPDGLSAFVAPNECGKSTAVSGLTAVVFGLPTSSDPSAWGQARFRSNAGGNYFEGTVEFGALDGQSYRVWRNFETHAVRVTRLDPAGNEVLLDGEHNPGARRGTGQYEALIKRLVGFTSAALFKSTFSVGQPLGDASLTHEVSALLAGSGGGSHQHAARALEEEIKARTKYTREYGLRNNMNNDRELEELQRLRNEKRQTICDGAAAADKLNVVQTALAETQRDEAATRIEVKRLEGKVGAVDDWLGAQKRFGEEQRTLNDLNRVLTDAQEEQGNIKNLEDAPLPSEGAERDWSFVDGSAASHLQHCREDAPAALQEYRGFARIMGDLEGHRTVVERLSLFDALSEEGLLELADYKGVHDQLEGAHQEAVDEEERIQEHIASQHPDKGYEDVARLSSAQVDGLQREARSRPPLSLVLALVSVVVGLVVGYVVSPEFGRLNIDLSALPFGLAAWPYGLGVALVVGVILLAVSLTVGGVVGGRRRRRQEEALAVLKRYETWEMRKAAFSPPNLSWYEERVTRTEDALDEFLKRTEPYRRAYDDVAEAARAYQAAQLGIATAERDSRQRAMDVWAVDPEEVETLDPRRATGRWRHLAELMHALGLDASTVASLARMLQMLAEEGRWDELERDAKAWDREKNILRQREAELAKRRATLQGMLQGENVQSVAELSEKVEAQRLETVAELQAFKTVCEAHRELPRHDDPNADRVALVEAKEQFASDLAAARTHLSALEEETHRLKGERAAAQGVNPINVAAMEDELVELEARIDDVKMEIEAFGLAYRTLKDAVTEYQDAYLERLAERCGAYFTEFTGEAERHVEVSQDFSIRVKEGEGVVLEPEQLSQGAQDQLALAVRLAIADMISNDLPLPLVFDDPFQNCDAERLARIEDALKGLARERQVLVLSHEEGYLEWGRPVEMQLPGA